MIARREWPAERVEVIRGKSVRLPVCRRDATMFLVTRVDHVVPAAPVQSAISRANYQKAIGSSALSGVGFRSCGQGPSIGEHLGLSRDDR